MLITKNNAFNFKKLFCFSCVKLEFIFFDNKNFISYSSFCTFAQSSVSLVNFYIIFRENSILGVCARARIYNKHALTHRYTYIIS